MRVTTSSGTTLLDELEWMCSAEHVEQHELRAQQAHTVHRHGGGLRREIGLPKLTYSRVPVTTLLLPRCSAMTGARAAAGDVESEAGVASVVAVRTVPSLASTTTSMPSFNVVVAFRVPTRQGMPSSRDTMAACDVMPPASVTIAAARRISGTQSGVVIDATSTSPFSSVLVLEDDVSTRTGPVATPGPAPTPCRSMVAAEGSAESGRRVPSVVTGRVCTR